MITSRLNEYINKNLNEIDDVSNKKEISLILQKIITRTVNEGNFDTKELTSLISELGTLLPEES